MMQLKDNEDIFMETEEVSSVISDPEKYTSSGTLNNDNPALFRSKTLLELSSSSWSRSSKAKTEVQPYLRGCKWSPDGTCCLTVVNNDGVHVLELPRDLYEGTVTSNRVVDVLDSVIHIKELGLIYDFCWYPGMNSALPETCCWITTRQHAPIQMWDAFDGSLRCSYRGFNHVDEMEPALCVTFTSDRCNIIAGYKKYLRTFDVNRPGREFSEQKISSSASCLATDGNLLAVGSWNTAISLYNITENGTYKSIGKMHGHGGGVTHMKFTPDGLKLVSGARKDNRLLVWDIRYYRRPLNILHREMGTNQRVYFDISPCGKYLVSGGTDGIVKVWAVDHVDWKNSMDYVDSQSDSATYKFPLHNDCCNSITIHPCRPIIATGSGQFHFNSKFASLDKSVDEPTSQKHTVNYFSDSVTGMDSEKSDSDQIQDFDMRNEKSALEINFKEGCSKWNRNLTKSRLVEKNESCNGFDMRYSSYSENCLVFWWTGEVPDLT